MFRTFCARPTSRCFCVASCSKKPDSTIVQARQRFEKKRMVSLKENFNKLMMIATADTKELVDFIKELDDLHKEHMMPTSVVPKENDNIFMKVE